MSAIALRRNDPHAGRNPADGEGRSWLAFVLLAVLAEGALLLGVAAWLQHGPTPTERQTPMQIVLEAPPPPPPKPVVQLKPPQELAPPPARPQQQTHIAKPPPRLRQAPPPRQPVADMPPPPPQAPPQPPEPVLQPQIVAPPPAPQTIPEMPVAPPAPTIVEPPVVDLQAMRAAYGQVMHAAIQAAVRYPDIARRMGESGRVRVTFRFEHGEVHDLHVLTSSGSGILDRAAERAVRQAKYPALPVALQGKALRLELWVAFNLDGATN